MVFSAGPFFAGAWRSLRARRIGMDVPVAPVIVVTFVASSGATFAPGGLFGREVYSDSLTMSVSFLLLGRLLETRARHRVAQVLESALAGMPETALRLDASDRVETVSVQRLVPGDRVRVRVRVRVRERPPAPCAGPAQRWCWPRPGRWVMVCG